MQIMLIGEYIKKGRLDQGLTQEELCEGCCAVSTLSRLESGKLVPGYTLVHALLQRLGLPEGQYFALLGENEAAAEALKKDIRADEIRFCKALADQRPKIREEAIEKLAGLGTLRGVWGLSVFGRISGHPRRVQLFYGREREERQAVLSGVLSL